MSVPLDLSLITQLLNEQQSYGDLNALTKPGFFFVIGPTNTPNNYENSCHVINLSIYIDNVYDEHNLRVFQIYINDNWGDNTVWYRQYFDKWTDWVRVARDDGIAYATMPQVTAEVTRILTTAEF